MNKSYFLYIASISLIVPVLALNANTQSPKILSPQPENITLTETGWTDPTRRGLEKLILAGAGQQRTVVFDFDNTIICRDIGSALFYTLNAESKLNFSSWSSYLKQSFRIGKDLVQIKGQNDLIAYYHALNHGTHPSEHDPTPHITSYAWLVQIMAGFTPWEIVQFTSQAFEKAATLPQKHVQPFFHPPMVELISTLLHYDYRVWIVSASNVWTVRWMVLHYLNPLLKARGSVGIPGDRVIGVSTLLKDTRSTFYKDPLLMQESPAYKRMEKTALMSYRLTNHIVFPLSGYYGKVANIMQRIKVTPYLIAGDSPNDHPMLSFAQNKLWIARLEKYAYQQKVHELIAQETKPSHWLIQPTLYKASPGFIASRAELEKRLKPIPRDIENSWQLLQKNKRFAAEQN